MNRESNTRPQVEVIKEFNSSPQKVFDAWLDPEKLGRWMFGPGVREEKIIKLETDPQKGGAFSFVVRRGDEVINHLGKYWEIERPNRLVFTWGVESESEDESIVTIDIIPTENGCLLTLIHEMDPKWAEYADRTKAGWDQMLEKLKEITVRL